MRVTTSSLLAQLSHDCARAFDPRCDHGATTRYVDDCVGTTETLLGRLDEIERAIVRCRDAAENAREEQGEALKRTVASLESDYALIDSVEEALRSIERACGSLEDALRDAERNVKTVESGLDGEAIRKKLTAMMSRVRSVTTETMNRIPASAGSGRSSEAVASPRGTSGDPTSPTSPSGYYFGEEEDEKEEDTNGSGTDVVRAKVSAIAASANKFVGSLADGFKAFRVGTSKSAESEPKDTNDDAEIENAE
ncbi:unnamed product [Ostreococcus tauri]|uniref:Unnamed product n=1 Tax=Ostreococcus tauri TaxID=70448 RepID=Q01A50_OSTTA|nr:unnamed product [Ostreococcus tauri]CAL51949.1 unnamed product [Ostreococcus tauri]|eukprot:XP_003079068.1 unnamed product [Ostreococcus tauri]